ncbi:MAG: Fe(2+) transporter permease subunit FeoB [Alphaproteobacteria bacterium]|nr:Fe(2+) transporter permease subunit FeoB [Alphaproteobacteria bacterium]
MSFDKTVALIGNPNCGKTTIFNALTGAHQYVGNWPGVTVEKKSGFFEKDGKKIEVVDLPGVYSLSVISATSEDEKIARDYLLFDKPDCVVNILDASNLERNLYMTVQLFEMHLPVILVLNMMDTARAAKIKIDVEALARLFNVPVIPMIASKTEGIKELKEQILQPVPPVNKDFRIPYAPAVEAAVEQFLPVVAPTAEKNGWSDRWLAVHLLDGDADSRVSGSSESAEKADSLRRFFEEKEQEEPDTLIADGRYGFITNIAGQIISRSDRLARNITERLDRIALGKYTGIPVFLLMMYLMFLWTISLGNVLIEPIADFGDEYLVDGFGALLTRLNAPKVLNIFLSAGVGRGIATVITFIPPIGFLFLFLSALEDSGYMSRGAFVMDRLMRGLGLPGTAFVPMIVAFGCTVPAVMGTRILSSRRDRLVTLMMTPFMSCGARLPVYALFATAFFSDYGTEIVFGLYSIGIIIAVLTGVVFKKTLFEGKPVPLILEMPPYHIPTIRNMAIRTWDRLHGFIVRAGVLIVPLVVVLNLMNSVDFKGNYIPETPQHSVLSSIGKSVTPVFEPMGISEQNWPATVGLFTGVMAKEALIGTLDALYAGIAAGESSTQRLAVFFDGRIGAFAYLLFILLYTPCLSALGAIAKEFGLKWAGVVALWTTMQAYLISTLFYQTAVMSRHVSYSVFWIAGILLAEVLIISGLRFAGKKVGNDFA